MIIGVDARELEGKRTGVGTYLRNILERIALPKDAKLQLYFKSEIPDVFPDLDAERILLKSAGSNLMWQQWKLRKELIRRRVNLFFSPANSAPLYYPGIQTITIHDLSFFRNPSWFSMKERLSRQFTTACSVRHADRIYAVSNPVRKEIIEHFRLPQSSVVVTPNGVSRKKVDGLSHKILRESYQIGSRKVILYVGLILNRRHVPALIRSMPLLDESYLLVLIGNNRTFPPQNLSEIAKAAGVENRVQVLEYVSDKVLHDYYQLADLFIYLSEYEGFGIPPLEAMSYDLPVIVSRTPAMDEIFRDAALFVNGFSPQTLQSAIQQILEPQTRSRLIEAGRKLVDQYSWDNTARIISEDWEHLLATHR
jgi:glycosyltransferase involved in cell wall biosynthesis